MRKTLAVLATALVLTSACSTTGQERATPATAQPSVANLPNLTPEQTCAQVQALIARAQAGDVAVTGLQIAALAKNLPSGSMSDCFKQATEKAGR